jgi:hypothetical protein
MLMNLIPQSKNYLANWIKKETQQSFVYRRPTSVTETSTGLGGRAGRRFTKPMAPLNRQE